MAAAVSACGKPVIKLPPSRPVTAGELHSEYREYLGIRVCQLDPRPVGEELRRMNDFLARFLDTTAAGQGSTLSDAQAAILKDALKSLPPALFSHGSVVKRVATCREFQGTPAYQEALRGQELVKQARARLAETPQLLANHQAALELKAWKEKQALEQQSERANWCPPKPTRIPEIYYAWEDEQGQTEWLFCDGSRVVSPPGGTPGWVPSQEEKAPRPAPPQTYLGSASRFPPKEIRRAPRPPGEVAPPPAAEAPKASQ